MTWTLAAGTHAGPRWLIGGLVLVLLIGALALTRRGPRHRDSRQMELLAPQVSFDDPGEQMAAPYAGRYLGSTFAGDWLDRITAHDLGVPTPVSVTVSNAGVLLARQGALDVAIPAHDLTRIRLANGLVGKVYGDNGVVVMTWRLGTTLVDTGIRADADQGALAQGLRALLSATGDAV